MSTLLKALMVGGVAAIAYRKWKQQELQESLVGAPYVRDAGPAEQSGVHERDWDMVDQQSDESFPASDPPANY